MGSRRSPYNRHAAPLLDALMPLLAAEEWRMAPLTVALQARVALGDEIGERLGARQVVMLIGERPGLTAPDSLGNLSDLRSSSRPDGSGAELHLERATGRVILRAGCAQAAFSDARGAGKEIDRRSVERRRPVTRLTRLRATPIPNSTQRQRPPSPPAHRMFRRRCAIPPRR